MDFLQASKSYYLDRSTYINLRWIAIIGQLVTINSVKFLLGFDFRVIGLKSMPPPLSRVNPGT